MCEPAGESIGLEGRWFHKLLLLTNRPAAWPGWVVACVVAAGIAALAGLWSLATDRLMALALAGAQLLAAGLDGLVLLSLPWRRVSHGPIGPQLLVLQLGRLAVAGGAAVLAACGLGPSALWVVAAVNATASAALVWGTLVEPARVGVTLRVVQGASVGGGADAIRLLHLSDLHLERWGRREEQILELVQTLAPDLIVLTGDYVNLSCVEDAEAHAQARRFLASLSAAAGVFAVLGSPPVDHNSAALFEGLPIRLLRNEVANAEVGSTIPGGARRALALVGLDCTHRPEIDGPQLHEVASQAPRALFRVLAYHSPELALAAPDAGIDLYLCGHTHGGQVRLPGLGALFTSSRLGKRFEMGCYEIGRTQMYVSRGIGMEGMGAPRVRFLCPPEITLFLVAGVPCEATAHP